ncbi:MAG: LPS assembly lipoprotein LptE [Verrucomicrobiae bacterium]|nr:LPS assembly lipoprotein LptE [Verrucomicrobiae bacterium]
MKTFREHAAPMSGAIAPTLAVALLAVLCCGGCAYRLGPTSTLDIKTVAVPNFKNQTTEARISVPITNAVIKRLQSDGSIRVVSEDTADATLTGEIVSWQRTPVRYNIHNAYVPSQYQLVVTAHVVLTNNRTGKRIFDTHIAGTTSYFFGDDLAQAERQAMPLAADDLAKRITDRIVDAW